jgi:hypothetical protein
MHTSVGTTMRKVAWHCSQGLPLLPMDGSTLYVHGLGWSPIDPIDSQRDVRYLNAGQLGNARVLTDPAGAVNGTPTTGAARGILSTWSFRR